MPRGGDQPGDQSIDRQPLNEQPLDGSQTTGRPLDRVKQEVRSALKLLFKDIAQDTVPMGFEPSVTVFLTDLMVESYDAPVRQDLPQVSADPIGILQSRPVAVQDKALLTASTISASDDLPCRFEPVASVAPVLEEMAFDSLGVSFDNLGLPDTKTWAVDPCQAEGLSRPVKAQLVPAVASVSPEDFRPRTYDVKDQMGQVRALQSPRFYGLPIRKAPVPPARFPMAVREKFRQSLAEKAGVSASQIQLRVVYERLDMNLYSAIQQDEQGSLWCTPKNELLGRNQERLGGGDATASSAGSPGRRPMGSSAAYLVYGIRLDNKEELRTLVPVGALD